MTLIHSPAHNNWRQLNTKFWTPTKRNSVVLLFYCFFKCCYRNGWRKSMPLADSRFYTLRIYYVKSNIRVKQNNSWNGTGSKFSSLVHKQLTVYTTRFKTMDDKPNYFVCFLFSRVRFIPSWRKLISSRWPSNRPTWKLSDVSTW